MGGWGSGGSAGSVKRTTESLFKIDIRRWQRAGWLMPGLPNFDWWCEGPGGRKFRIRVQLALEETAPDNGPAHAPEGIRLQYHLRDPGAELRYIDHVVLLTSTPGRYGRRRWFLCGGRSCPHRRAAVLYLGGDLFLCRRCYNLAYESENEDRITRALGQIRKVRRRMGAAEDDWVFAPLPPRPRRMRRTTYERLAEKAARTEEKHAKVAIQSFLVLEKALLRQLGDDAPQPAWNDPPSALEIFMLKERESERRARRRGRPAKRAPGKQGDAG